MNYVFVCIVILLAVGSLNALVPTNVRVKRVSHSKQDSRSALFAHHPQKKIIKKIMDKRPIKHRLSDINRKNVNLGKCITKVENAPSEYTIISASDFEAIRVASLQFWNIGDPNAVWHEITEEDKALSIPQNIEPLPVGGIQKRPPIFKQRLH